MVSAMISPTWVSFLFALSRDQVFDGKKASKKKRGAKFLFALSRDQVFDSSLLDPRVHACTVSIRSFARSGLRLQTSVPGSPSLEFLFALSRDQVFDNALTEWYDHFSPTVSIRSFARSGLRPRVSQRYPQFRKFLFALSRDQVFDLSRNGRMATAWFLFALSRDQVFDARCSWMPETFRPVSIRSFARSGLRPDPSAGTGSASFYSLFREIRSSTRCGFQVY